MDIKPDETIPTWPEVPDDETPDSSENVVVPDLG